MKNILFTLTILSILLITSCGKDEPDLEIGLAGTVTFDGNANSITDGIFAEASGRGVYVAVFILADGPVSYDPEEEEEATLENQEGFVVGVSISSKSDAFETGDYNIIWSLDNTLSVDKFAFVSVGYWENGEVKDDEAIGGTVNIQRSGNNTFTLTFEADFADDVKLTGNASGSFAVIDITDIVI